MQPSTAIPDPVRRTEALPCSASFIRLPHDQSPPGPFAEASSFIVFAPPRRKPRTRRPPAWRARAAAYASTLAADDYLEATREALRAGDDSAARDCLAVLRGIVEVAISQVHGSLPNTLVLN